MHVVDRLLLGGIHGGRGGHAGMESGGLSGRAMPQGGETFGASYRLPVRQLRAC